MDESDNLDSLLARLEDNNIDVVEATIRHMAQNPDKRAIGPLVDLLRRSRTDFILHNRLAGLIAYALDEIHDASCIAHLFEEVHYLWKNELFPCDAGEVTYYYLEGFNDLGLSPFLDELANADPLRREIAVYYIGYEFELQAEEAVIAALDDPDAEVQEAAADTLKWAIRTPQAFLAIKEWRQKRSAQSNETDRDS